MTDTKTLPLFPLNTVLFPGGVLPLRIFEPRYLDMVAECFRTDSGFVVISVQEADQQNEGDKADNQSLQIATIGTLAKIIDFDQLDDGCLGITCLGLQRFRVIQYQHTQPQELLMGTLRELPDDPRLQPLPKHEPLIRFLHDLLEHEEMAFYSRFLTPDWDNAAWIGNRLAEVLLPPPGLRQKLLEMTDPQQRLTLLLTIFHEMFNASKKQDTV